MVSVNCNDTSVMVDTVTIGAWIVVEVCFRRDKTMRGIHVAWIPVGMLP